MDNYCYLSLKKMKDFAAMDNTFKHNHRLKEVANANPELTVENRILINRKEKSYTELYNETINSEYDQDKKIRKDAVKGLEVLVSFSHDADKDLDLDEWINDNITFIANHFGGRKNIKDAVLHMDESTPHIHFFIIPMVDGRLCAKDFISGPKSLRKLQDEYGKAMKKHNLVRGEKGSFLKHKDIRKFYSELGEVLGDELPPPEETEDAKSYYNRVNKLYKDTMLSKLKEKDELERSLNEKYRRRLKNHRIYKEFATFAKEIFGSRKLAKEKLMEKYYEDMALEATKLANEIALNKSYKKTIMIMKETGKVYADGKSKAEAGEKKEGDSERD